jgi:hypothetical protein
MSNILFYSTKCNTCKHIFTLLQNENIKNENLLSYFKLICIDDPNNKIPNIVTEVPTMIVTTINKPMIAKEIFEWIQSVKFMKQSNANNTVTPNKKEKIGPLGFVSQEMSGFSDSFAYKDIDMAQPHTFVSINNNDEKNAIFTAPEHGKINSDIQNEKIKNLKQSRDEQDKNYNIYLKNKHQYLESKINNNKNTENTNNKQSISIVEQLKKNMHLKNRKK